MIQMKISKTEYDFLKIKEFKYDTLRKCLLDSASLDLYEDELRFSYDKFIKIFTTLDYFDCKMKLRELKLLQDKEKDGD